jgi:hypothetical protein
MKPQRKMRKLKTWARFLLIFASVSTTSCGLLWPSAGSRVIFVPESTGMVRLGEDVSGHVYIMKDGTWTLSKDKVELPAGWYAGSLDQEPEE